MGRGVKERMKQLTDKEHAFFDTFGYLSVPQLLSTDEVAAVTEAFEWTVQNCGGGTDHDGSTRTMLLGPIEHSPVMCALLDHPGVAGLISGVLGEDFNYASGDGNFYSGDTGKRHSDGSWGQLWAAKTAFLDPVTRDSGCLRVIPGSHRPDHYLRAQGISPNDAQERFGVSPSEFPGDLALESNPGDVVIFNHDLFHASFGGSKRRRMFTMNCIRRATTPQEEEMSRRYVSAHSPGGYKLKTGNGMYWPTLLQTADDQRLRHLSQLSALHDELFPELAAPA